MTGWAGKERLCGLPNNWTMAHTAELDELGFEKGATSLYRKRGIKLVV